MRHIIPISGKDSLATALLQTAHQPELEYEYMFNDVSTELPETYEWLDRVEEKTGWTIQRVGANLEEVIDSQGMLPSRNVRFCTRMAKIKPMQEWLAKGDEEVTLYYGLRADEDRKGYVPVDGQQIVYPLQDMGIDRDGVFRILKTKDLRPPSFWWDDMYNRVVGILGDGWQDAFDEWQMEDLFAWRTRSNCYFCFFQRQYEWIGLYEHHPDLYWRAVEIEESTGADDYTWRKYSMRVVDDPEWREKRKDRRARKIAQHIKDATQYKIFRETGDNQISRTSCGLLCGK